MKRKEKKFQRSISKKKLLTPCPRHLIFPYAIQKKKKKKQKKNSKDQPSRDAESRLVAIVVEAPFRSSLTASTSQPPIPEAERENERKRERERGGKARKREPAGTSSQYCITIPPHLHPFPFLSAATLRLSSPPSVLAESLSKVRGYARKDGGGRGGAILENEIESRLSLACTKRKRSKGRERKKEGRRFARPFFLLLLFLPLSFLSVCFSLSPLFLFFFLEGNKRGRK